MPKGSPVLLRADHEGDVVTPTTSTGSVRGDLNLASRPDSGSGFARNGQRHQSEVPLQSVGYVSNCARCAGDAPTFTMQFDQYETGAAGGSAAEIQAKVA